MNVLLTLNSDLSLSRITVLLVDVNVVLATHRIDLTYGRAIASLEDDVAGLYISDEFDH